MQLGPHGCTKVYATNSTSSAFSLSAGRTATRPTSGLLVFGNMLGARPRYIKAVFFGTGTATTTFDYKVWAVSVGVGANNTIEDYDLQLLCSGTATLGTTTGVATTGITSSDKICDTLTTATATYGAAIVSAFGGVVPSAYSPGSNGEATLFIPECGNAYGLVFEFDMTGATSGNVLVEWGV